MITIGLLEGKPYIESENDEVVEFTRDNEVISKRVSELSEEEVEYLYGYVNRV